MMGVVVPTLATQHLDVSNLPAEGWAAVWIAIVVLVVLGCFAYLRQAVWRRALSGAGALIIAALILIPVLTATDRRVQEAVDGICDDGMWARPPACYQESVHYVARNFEVFDPEQWHGWDEVGKVDTVALSEVPRLVHTLSGSAFATIGVVLVTQPSGTLIIQLAPPEQTDLDRVDEAAARAILGSEYDNIVAGTVHGTTPNARAYCALPPRPFFAPTAGDVLAVTGSPVAFGTVPEQNSTATNQSVYLLCSAAEKLNH